MSASVAFYMSLCQCLWRFTCFCVRVCSVLLVFASLSVSNGEWVISVLHVFVSVSVFTGDWVISVLHVCVSVCVIGNWVICVSVNVHW